MPQLEIIQTIGPAGEATPLLPTGHNRLLQGDCLALMGALPAESFDLLYLDPPFFSGQDYHLHDGAAHPSPSFRDTWEGGVHAYLDWLGQRLTAMHRLLRPTGALLVHLDWHAVHYVKVWLDHLFGYNHFQNEFIWYYSGGGASKKRFARKHDTILYYTKSAKEWTFHADAVRTAYKWTDGQKRADGSARNYQRGKLPDDVWEHHALLPWGFESLGYPTQKPEALLERLIAATTNAGEVVGDFFCGSGTTAAVAQRLGRRWVTADESRVAICLAAERLAQLLAPTPPPRHAQRARAQAHARFAAIHDDPTRFGLEASTLTTCNLTLIPPPGMTVERLGGVDLSAGGP